jgi:hypothetical protein
VRTLGGLQDALDSEYSWRLKEIANLKLSVRREQSLPQTTLIRAGVAIVYAHWEGFIKAASISYLEYVNSLGLTYGELKTCFAVLGMKSHLNTLIVVVVDPRIEPKTI